MTDITRGISLLGSTGSIGRQTLETAELLGLRVLALCADTNVELLEQQTRKFRPLIVAVNNESACRDFKSRVRDLDVRVTGGVEGLVEAACVPGADTVVTAVVGTAGLLPTLAAARSGRRIALANKETLVCAGQIVMAEARANNAEIIPVDSEHSALFQCLRDEPVDSVKNLILTASGGPFRGKSRSELTAVTPEMALKHPNWSMGRKITIDSATMMNKGLEVIEATHLFQVSPEKIKVVVHPESVVHSMVEFTDNSVIAQLSRPDMRLPIQYALTWPARVSSLVDELDITRLSALTFYDPDMDAFPCLPLAISTAGICGTTCAVLNAANEAAVQLFLQGELSFYGIYDLISDALQHFENIPDPSLEDIIAADEAARRFAFDSVRCRV